MTHLRTAPALSGEERPQPIRQQVSGLRPGTGRAQIKTREGAESACGGLERFSLVAILTGEGNPERAVKKPGSVSTRWYDAELSAKRYGELSQSDLNATSWLLLIEVDIPGKGSNRFWHAPDSVVP